MTHDPQNDPDRHEAYVEEQEGGWYAYCQTCDWERDFGDVGDADFAVLRHSVAVCTGGCCP